MKTHFHFKKLALMLLFIFAFLVQSIAQDIVKLQYKYYTSWFSKKEHIPMVVSYNLTKSMLSCTKEIERLKSYYADPANKNFTNLNKYYTNSGYDRGHNMNAEDNRCDSIGMRQCFYYTNMTPQPHEFNAGKWEELERYERTQAEQYNSIIVTCGSVGVQETIKDSLVVPKYMWKVIYIATAPTSKRYQCYIFPNTSNVTKALSTYAVKLTQIENLASVTFNRGNVTLHLEEE
jgi:endonuclease G, mitochondrial